MKKPHKDSEPLLTTAQVAEMTHTSRSSLYRLIESGRGPEVVRLGPRMLRFRPHAVQVWLRDRTEP